MLISPNPLLKTVAYLRYSDYKQKGNHSLEIQKAQILIFAERNGLDIISWCIDESTSAYSSNILSRKGMQQVLKEIKNGAEAFVFYEESRLTRQITDFYTYVYLAIKKEFPTVLFFSTNHEGEWDPNSPIVQAKFVFASEESEIKSFRAKDTHLKILTQKNPTRPGSRNPLGYDMVEGTLIPNQDADVALLIYFLSVWGHSHKNIATYLNDANITTRKTSVWNGSTIGYILNNPAYEGILKWENNKIGLFTSKKAHQPIIGSTILYLSKQNTALKKTFSKMDTPFFFRDLLECTQCNSNLIAKDHSPKGKSKKYLSYKCGVCKKTINIEIVHTAVFKELTLNISAQNEVLIKKARSMLFDYLLKLEDLNQIALYQLDTHYQNLEMLNNSLNPNKDTLIKAFNESIAYFNIKIDEYASLKSIINTMIEDKEFDKTLTTILQSHIYTLSNTEKRVFSLNVINKIQINFQKDCDLSIEFRLTPFVSLENSLVEKPN